MINVSNFNTNQKIYISCAVVATIVVIILLAIFICKRFYCNKHYKEATYLKLSSFADNNDFLLLNNYKIDYDESHKANIDHVLISKKYIFIINDFGLSGVITGELKSRYLNIYRKKDKVEQVSNPLNYNINLLKRFNLDNNLDQSFTRGIIVVNDDAIIDVKNESDQFYIVRRADLKKLILKIDKCDEKNLKEESIVRFINKLNERK